MKKLLDKKKRLEKELEEVNGIIQKGEEDIQDLDKIEEMTLENKAQRFGIIYGVCLRHMNKVLEDGYEKDGEHWIFERVMEVSFGKDIWKFYNNYCEEE